MDYLIMCSFKSPVVLLTYRKHEALEEILHTIALYEPPKLFIFQDKAASSEDVILTDKVKEIIQNFNFNFPVEYICHNTPLKLNKAVKTALDYCFAKEETLIVLEDDIVPNMSFFDFCNHLLVKYKGSSEIGCINGCNLNAMDIEDKYIYSDISFPYWGWASWREKWFNFRFDNYYWNLIQQEKLNLSHKKNYHFFKNVFEANANSINVWDLQWNLTLIANSYKTIIPTVNLVKNNGFVSTALSTRNPQSFFSDMKTTSININALKKKTWNNNKLVRKYESKIKAFVKEVSNNIDKTKIEDLKYVK